MSATTGGTQPTKSSIQVSVSPSTISFGPVAVGASASSKVSLLNSGTASVGISQLSISDKSFFIFTQDPFPVTVAAGATYTFEASFSPASAGAFSGQLTVMDAAASPIAEVSMSGSGVEPATEQITVAPSNISFGNVPVNSESTQSLKLSSTGTAPVTVTSATLTGAGFSMSGATFPVTLNPGMTLALSVQFAPTASGAVNGQLTVNSNSTSGGTTTIALSGTGTNAAKPQLTISPSSLSFGDMADNSKSKQTLTLSSTGTVPVTISSATLTGAGFTMSGATFPVTLNPNLAIAIAVQFAPTTTGAAAGQLTFVSNSFLGSTSVVAISGTGTAVQHEVDLNWSAPASSMDTVEGYNIYRSAGTSMAYQKLDSSLDTQTSYVDRTVQSGLSYTYIVKSVDLAGIESAPSNPLSVTIP